MASRPEQLYEEDFYAWTRDQAQALRRLAASRPNLALDFALLGRAVGCFKHKARAPWGTDRRVPARHAALGRPLHPSLRDPSPPL